MHINWKKNLIIISLAQFFSMIGFSLALPFNAYYIQFLGVSDPQEIKMWNALATSSAGITFALASPVWGMLADRYGRKPMMLRATVGASVLLFLMGIASDVRVFVVLRLCQGLFTGTISAANTFVASNTPEHKQGMALGTLSTATFTGLMVGPLVGGLIADTLGYQKTFFIASVILLFSSIFIFAGVKEKFKRAKHPVTSTEKTPTPAVTFAAFIPVLLTLSAFSAARTFDQPILPLYIQEINGSIQGSSKIAGLLSGLTALGSAIAGIVAGRIIDRTSFLKVGTVSSFFAGVFCVITGLFPLFYIVFPTRFLFAFFSGGLDPVFQVWLSRITPSSKKGTVFGWATTSRSVGWALSPLLSGSAAIICGIRPIFVFGGVLFMLLIPLFFLIPIHQRRTQEAV